MGKYIADVADSEVERVQKLLAKRHKCACYICVKKQLAKEAGELVRVKRA